MAKILEGKVVSKKMKNTIVVVVERKLRHPLYRKVIKRHKKFKVHVEQDNVVELGQVVKIKETKPISKDKHFILVNK
jgi:small subunit ribosomal protein S17